MFTPEEKAVLAQAAEIIESKSLLNNLSFCHADVASQYAASEIAHFEKEVFLVIFLNSQHYLIKSEILFTGTINSAAVYPREIVKRALELNSAAIIISHNHPSMISEPSQADISITHRIGEACRLLDISLLDHLVVGSTVTSLAQRGLL